MAAYKAESRVTTVSAAISDGFSALEELASECREIVDNASEGLSQTQRIQTLSDTADTLENLSEPNDVPGDVAEMEVSYTEYINKNKRRAPSRATRCSNACAMLQGAKDSLETWVELHRKEDEKLSDEMEEKMTEVESIIEELDNASGEADGCEFPGMFG